MKGYIYGSWDDKSLLDLLVTGQNMGSSGFNILPKIFKKSLKRIPFVLEVIPQMWHQNQQSVMALTSYNKHATQNQNQKEWCFFLVI